MLAFALPTFATTIMRSISVTLIVLALAACSGESTSESTADQASESTAAAAQENAVSDSGGKTKNVEKPAYSLEGNPVDIEHGVVEGGTVSLLTSASGDINGDSADDEAAVLVLNSSGSGVFYYLNVLLNDGSGAQELAEEAFLGDRIKIDFIDIYGPGSVSQLTGVPIHSDDYGQVIVAYYTYGRDQAFSEEPRIYLTRHWKIQDGDLVNVEDY